MLYEFKGHRSFCPEELPNYVVPGSTRPSRQAISKYACGMLNTGKGGVILMGVLDDGRIEGFSLTRFQQDHIMLTIEDTLDRYNPPVPKHMYEIIFTPVIDLLTHQSPEEELEAITKWMTRPTYQDRTLPHQLRTSQFCWCDRAANAQFTLGHLNPFFIVELHLQSWDPKDVRSANLFSVRNFFLCVVC